MNENSLNSIIDILNTINYSDYKIYKPFQFYSTAPIEEKTNLPFLFRLRSIRYLKYLIEHRENVAGVICPYEIADEISNYFPTIGASEAERLFWIIHNKLYCPSNSIANIGNNCSISSSAALSKTGIIIGDNVIIEENVVIREGVSIGNDSIIRAGCIIGGEGFQHYKNAVGSLSIRHLGRVEIGSNVEIQYNSCVDKALYVYMATIIGDGSRIDNLVHIGHGANLASGVFVASGAVIGGYANIGKDSFIGMNAAVRQHVCIGAESLVGMNSGVIRNVESKKTVAGFPARAIN